MLITLSRKLFKMKGIFLIRKTRKRIMARTGRTPPRPTNPNYTPYIAAFVVMLLIIVCAICVLSGCLDNLFAPNSAGDNTVDAVNPDVDNPVGDIDTDKNDQTEPISSETDEPDETKPSDETEPVAPSDSSSTEDTTKAPETTTKAEDTTKAPETTKTPETTTQAPETTVPPQPVESPVASEVITEEDDRISCKYMSNHIVVEGYDGTPPQSISVAKSIDGLDVRKIGARAFFQMDEVKTVRLSWGITEIGSEAMGSCSSLSSVYIPQSVKTIASDAFSGSDNVTIYCADGSYAEKFAEEHSLPVVIIG